MMIEVRQAHNGYIIVDDIGTEEIFHTLDEVFEELRVYFEDKIY